MRSQPIGRPLAMLAMAVLVTACGGPATTPAATSEAATSAPAVSMVPAAGSPRPAPSASSSPTLGAIVGDFDIGGRSLHLACVGTGSPTVILEGGDGDPTNLMLPVRDVLSTDYRTCIYDRAGKGTSDLAPTPRLAAAMTEDLGRLLEVAAVPGPYLPVGTSLGGVAAYLFAAAHPDDVVGFVSINPPTDPTLWNPAIRPLVTDAEYADEVAYGNGQLGHEHVDLEGWIEGAAPPDEMPYYVLDSGTTQCDGDPLCLKVYDVIVAQTKDIASRGDGGHWMQIPGSHQLQLSNPDDVLPLIRAIAEGRAAS